MRFNLKNGLASQKKLSVSAVDFPRVNESYTGRYKTRSNYMFKFVVFFSIWKSLFYFFEENHECFVDSGNNGTYTGQY